MSWQPEDWKKWLEEAGPTSPGDPAHVRALQGILGRLPASFSRIDSIESDAHVVWSEPLGLRAGRDVIVAVDSIQPATVVEFDRILERIRATLREGGVFLATFPATPFAGRPAALPIRSAGGCEPPTFHEVALQYRLRRAGFQGLRMKRFRQEATGCDSILCMAVRRASN